MFLPYIMAATLEYSQQKNFDSSFCLRTNMAATLIVFCVSWDCVKMLIDVLQFSNVYNEVINHVHKCIRSPAYYVRFNFSLCDWYSTRKFSDTSVLNFIITWRLHFDSEQSLQTGLIEKTSLSDICKNYIFEKPTKIKIWLADARVISRQNPEAKDEGLVTRLRYASKSICGTESSDCIFTYSKSTSKTMIMLGSTIKEKVTNVMPYWFSPSHQPNTRKMSW